MQHQEQLQTMANEMGISLYGRFSLAEASAFLNISQEQLQQRCHNRQIAFLALDEQTVAFFGQHLLDYLLSSVVAAQTPAPASVNADRILRIKEVCELTGLSRTTIWRREINDEFPKRVSLGGSAVGWKASDIDAWMQSRN